LVPLNFRLVPEDHEYIIKHAGVKAVLVDYEYTQIIDQIRDRLPDVQHFIAASYDGNVSAGWTDWNQLIANEPTTAPEPVEIDENDVATINYTSGTTARPKGV